RLSSPSVSFQVTSLTLTHHAFRRSGFCLCRLLFSLSNFPHFVTETASSVVGTGPPFRDKMRLLDASFRHRLEQRIRLRPLRWRANVSPQIGQAAPVATTFALRGTIAQPTTLPRCASLVAMYSSISFSSE